MSAPDAGLRHPHAVTLAAIDALILSELLSHLDEFLRSSAHHSVVAQELRAFAADHGTNAGYLIDAVSIFAARMNRLTAGIDRGEAEFAAVADLVDEDSER